MFIGPITKDLIACLDGESINTTKFFSMRPQTDNVKNALYDLRKKGYITMDEGDNRIIEIAATQRLLDLAKVNQ